MTGTLYFGNNTITMGASPDQGTAPAPLARLFLFGRFERGPVGQPITVSSNERFLSVFGAGAPLTPTAEGAEVVEDYFKRVGRTADAVIVRLLEGNADAMTAKEAPVTPLAGGVKARYALKASSPGKFGDNLDRSVVEIRVNGAVVAYTVEVRESVGGVVKARRTAARFTPGDLASLQAANSTLRDLAVIVEDTTALDQDGKLTAGNVNFADVTAANAAPIRTPFTGGADSPQITPSTLRGGIDPDSQERTGLYTVRSTEYGGGVVGAVGMDTLDHRKVLAEFARETARYTPFLPAADINPSAALTDKQSCELIDGAEYTDYVYPRARKVTTTGPVTKSALGYVAAEAVLAVLSQPGKVLPPAGVTSIPDVQRAANGRDLLVHELNERDLQRAGIRTLLMRGSRVELQGLSLTKADPLQPATDKIYERLLLNTLAYDIGPSLSRFNNSYVDAQGVFFDVVRGVVRDKLTPYFKSGVLFGATVDEAFSVQIDFTNNTTADLVKSARANVKVKVRISAVSEGIDLEIFHIPLTSTL
ncbi:hypothetical protein [Deinococcus kurensis]|uniref:hypothetical protein n=1 Tax=Deinococcus kurensis TaxID=2662757 RepID=UPI0012D2CA57|nr:hypothetical protein [Deinococcus kurensis]